MSLLRLSQALIDAFELRVPLDFGDGAVERGAVALVLPVGPILGRPIGVSHQSPPLSLTARNTPEQTTLPRGYGRVRVVWRGRGRRSQARGLRRQHALTRCRATPLYEANALPGRERGRLRAT